MIEFLKKHWVKIVVAITVLYIIRKFSMSFQGDGKTTTTTTKPKSSFKYDESKVNRDKKIYLGLSNSHEVAYLQIWLNTYFATNLKVDGDFGAKSMAALKSATGKIGGSLNDLGA